MSKVKFSIIGCGRIGLRHAEHIVKQAELVSACDIRKSALENFSKKFPWVKLYDSIDELLKNDKDSEVINVCTPNGLHAEHTIKALKNGKHVVCEKPMALSVRDAEMMVKVAEESGKNLFIVKQNRYNPPVQKVKRWLDEGVLGKIYSAQINCFWNRNRRYYEESDWKGTMEMDGGILYTQFSHFIDLVCWFMGDVENVEAYMDNLNHNSLIEFEDTLVAILKFKSGAIAALNCTINSFSKNMEGSITLFCENGTVKIGGQYLNKLEYQEVSGLKIEKINENRPANDYGYYQGSMSNHDKVIENVIDVLRNDGKIATTGYEGLKTVEIIEMIYSKVR